MECLKCGFGDIKELTGIVVGHPFGIEKLWMLYKCPACGRLRLIEEERNARSTEDKQFNRK